MVSNEKCPPNGGHCVIINDGGGDDDMVDDDVDANVVVVDDVHESVLPNTKHCCGNSTHCKLGN